MKKYISISIIILSFSCKNKIETKIDDSNYQVFTINFSTSEKNEKTINISDFTDSISYINLETNKDLLMQSIKSIKYNKDKIYISDFQGQELFIYNTDGKFLNKLNNSGRGPGEYLAISQFEINYENGNIHILDDIGSKIFIYTQNGEFIKSIKVDDIIRDFALLPSGDYLFYTPDYSMGDIKRGLWKVDANGVFKEQLIDIDPEYRYGGIYPRYFQRVDNKTVGLLGGEDKDFIYHITDESIFIAYKFDVDIKITETIKRTDFMDPNKLKGRAYTKNEYQETNRYIFLNISNYEENISFLYDKKKKQTIINSRGNYNNDIDSIGGKPLRSTFNNSMIFMVSEKLILNNQEIRDKLNTSINDNPVLQILYLKN